MTGNRRAIDRGQMGKVVLGDIKLRLRIVQLIAFMNIGQAQKQGCNSPSWFVQGRFVDNVERHADSLGGGPSRHTSSTGTKQGKAGLARMKDSL